jgi:hypothetical protein
MSKSANTITNIPIKSGLEEFSEWSGEARRLSVFRRGKTARLRFASEPLIRLERRFERKTLLGLSKSAIFAPLSN